MTLEHPATEDAAAARPLEGRCALVTGGAKRIGEAIVLALADAGAEIVIHHHTSEDAAEAVRERVRAAGGRAWIARADLSDEKQADALLGEAERLSGRVDILVNNASIFPDSSLAGLDAAALEKNLRVNTLAPLRLGRRFAAQGVEGCIINLLDAAITRYDAAHVAYHLSKRMLFDLTRMMAVDFAPAVRVNAVAPGLVLAPPGRTRGEMTGAEDRNLLRRWGSPDDVADAVLFLARSPFITGQVIFVDGGEHVKGAMYG